MFKLILQKIKNHLPYILLILITTCVFFQPAIQDKIIQGGDVISSYSWHQELRQFAEINDKTYYWNNSMFSGMPWAVMSLGQDNNIISGIINIANYKYPIYVFFKAGLFCYFALIFLGISRNFSLLGALSFMFSVFFIILIAAGHQSKVESVAAFPLILSGFILMFRRKYILSFFLISFGLSVSLLGGHVQMIYYFFISLFFITISLIVPELKNKNFKHVVIASSVIILAMFVGLLSNFSKLYSSKLFSEDTMRGKAILKTENVATNEKGLNWDYAMNWSNSVSDLFTVLIPNYVGGSSNEGVSETTEIGKILKANGYKKDINNKYKAPTYWGGLPGSSGPYYIGAAFLFFYVLFLFFGKNKLKIGFSLAIIITLLLSLGSNAKFFNEFLFNNLPLFTKFRAPNSSMSILSVFFIFPAIITLDSIFKLENVNKNVLSKFYKASGLSLGLIALLYFVSLTFSFTNPAIDANYGQEIIEAFKSTRKTLFNQDLMRVFFISLLIISICWAYIKGKIKSSFVVSSLIIVIVLVDLWTVNRRYLNDENYLSWNQMLNTVFVPSAASKKILALEKSRSNYRVYNGSTNTFNDAITSFYHNSIGGYSAIKLRRYQDIIEHHLAKGNMNVFNMLNAKYFISKEGEVQTNNNANGNAWFVKNLKFVDNPNEEIDALTNFDSKNEAVLLKSEFEAANNLSANYNNSGKIKLTHYEPGLMKYNYNTTDEEFAVFSEVWYDNHNGWKATINGKEIDIFRVNYILRGVLLPAGNNEIVFSFNPKAKLPFISIIFSIIIILSFLIFLYFEYFQKNEN